jgi:hypothetical protein
VLDLFRDLIDKMSDDELNQFLDKFRRLRTEKNQAKPDQSKTPECTSASTTPLMSLRDDFRGMTA